MARIAILRIRTECLPVVDLIYSTQTTGNGQITDFFEPDQFGDISVSEQGAALSSPCNLAPLFDLHWRVGYRRIEREGIIEFHPEALEDIDQLEVNTAVSRFIGPDKLTVQFVAVDQEFVPNPFNPPRRNRTIVGGNVLYQLFRGSPNRSSGLSDPYSRQFDPGGWEFFGGVLNDREAFGEVDVTKNDYFGGVALRRYSVPRFKDMISSFDFLLQSTVLDSHVSGDDSQNNGQYRTTAVLLARLLDEERSPSLPDNVNLLYPAFVHFVIPFKHDLAIQGPSDFENFSLGAHLYAKLFATPLLGTGFLLSAGYSYERFYNLDKDVHLYHISASMGFTPR